MVCSLTNIINTIPVANYRNFQKSLNSQKTCPRRLLDTGYFLFLSQNLTFFIKLRMYQLCELDNSKKTFDNHKNMRKIKISCSFRERRIHVSIHYATKLNIIKKNLTINFSVLCKFDVTLPSLFSEIPNSHIVSISSAQKLNSLNIFAF